MATHVLAATAIYNHLGTAGEKGRTLQEPGETISGKKALPIFYRIEMQAGETLSAKNRHILDKYIRIVETLNGRQIEYRHGIAKILEIKNSDF